MSVRVVAASCTIAWLFLGGCSLATSWSDLPIGPLDLPDASRVDAAKTVIDSGPIVADSGPDVIDSGGACPTDQYFCGDPTSIPNGTDTLYGCVGVAGTQVAVTVCTHGCLRRQPLATDACNCNLSGLYCGNDQIPGDPNTLYRCNPDYSGTKVMKCAAGCEVNKVGQDDKCK